MNTGFLDEIAAGLRIHRLEYGSYTAGAYYCGSTAEDVFHYVCQLLDAIEESKRDAPNEPAAASILDREEWGDEEYLKSYFQLLLDRVLERLAQGEAGGAPP
jgi:hypothetical protein